MDNKDIKIYDKDLKLDGTIPELVDQANRYTESFTDEALEMLSEKAKEFGLDDKYVEIPLLLKNERFYEASKDGDMRSAYMRLKINRYLGEDISYQKSNYGVEGTELEIMEESGNILISLIGEDEQGGWTAAGCFTVAEFLAGEPDWLDIAIGSTLYYHKQYEEAESDSSDNPDSLENVTAKLYQTLLDYDTYQAWDTDWSMEQAESLIKENPLMVIRDLCDIIKELLPE